ncbi:MAG: hypothetical protein KIH08_11870 [Candidatus Freyarchaeota archaeon]|nr:hypothetical protein [Candidatus Jordarchaeia archaeon]MBS7269329.1 hypothetical protein [Candidatus Jordarchaeia archaeon]MBS7280500.1 hypothetical protein [Candidatus Jordarchaeia archaeon]
MTQLEEVEKKCILCGKESKQIVVISTNTVGSPDLDTRPPEMKRSTLPYWIEFCPECGFCAPDISEAPPEAAEIVRSEAYQQQLHNPEFPALANKFLCLSLILEKIGVYVGAGWCSVHAAWACDDTYPSRIPKIEPYYTLKTDIIRILKFLLTKGRREGLDWETVEKVAGAFEALKYFNKTAKEIREAIREGRADGELMGRIIGVLRLLVDNMDFFPLDALPSLSDWTRLDILKEVEEWEKMEKEKECLSEDPFAHKREAAVKCRIRAANMFLKAREHDQNFSDKPGKVESVIVDLLRRAGQFDQALKICEEGLKKNPEGITKHILLFQKKLIAKQDVSRYTVDEAIGIVEYK